MTERMASLKLLVVLSLAAMVAVWARDPDIVTDFVVPSGVNATDIGGDFFTFSGLINFSAPAGKFALKKVTQFEFPALAGLGVGVTLLEYHPGTLNPPHTHPRGSELLYVISGKELNFGIVDSSNKLYHGHLHQGDLAVFPQGLVHFQINVGRDTVRAISAFGSSNAGTISLPRNIFGSQIEDEVLLKAFNITSKELKVLKTPYAV